MVGGGAAYLVGLWINEIVKSRWLGNQCVVVVVLVVVATVTVVVVVSSHPNLLCFSCRLLHFTV